MRMFLKSLRFNLPDNPFGSNADKLSSLVTDLKKITKRAGTDNDKYNNAISKIKEAIQFSTPIEDCIQSKTDVRAFAAVLTEHQGIIEVTNSLLSKITVASNRKPNNLIIESLFQHYLDDYNEIKNVESICYWLVKARIFRKINKWYDEKLLSPNGAKWVAELAITKQTDFDQIIHELELDQFQSGQFMEAAQRIYYVEQLKHIPLNQPHELLIEVQKIDVFKSKFDESELLGHKILKVLIERAPSDNIHESWRNVIMKIAGDPRIPKSHQRYITWWSHIPQHLISKVRGWLSNLDLKLFLEALEDFSKSSNDPEMMRMYPSRKRFLEGLYDNKVILNTRLYMSLKMANYLKRNYKAEHLPDFSLVTNTDKSIIYAELPGGHMIEGSHSCYFWVYKELDPSATVFDYGKKQESYDALTMGMGRKMVAKGISPVVRIQHNPTNFNWQKKAVDALRYINVNITMKDVLTPDDYRAFVRRFGAS